MSEKIFPALHQVSLACPHCGDHVSYSEDKLHAKLYRIQGSDDTLHDRGAATLVELWYCPWCDGYFRAYYHLQEIKPLKEQE